YLSPATEFSPAEAERFAARGFEIGLHGDSGCKDRPNPFLASQLDTQLQHFRRKYPGLPAQETHRIHCVVWNGWISLARLQRDRGIRFDLNYYYWPSSWVDDRPGFMTGSGFPMPFVDSNGRVL